MMPSSAESAEVLRFRLGATRQALGGSLALFQRDLPKLMWAQQMAREEAAAL